MKLQDKWDQFMATGRVADYMEYRLCAGGQPVQQNAAGDKRGCSAEEKYGGRDSRSDRDGTQCITG